MYQKIVVFALVATLTTSISATDVDLEKYLCVTDLSTGFFFDRGKWRIADFDVRKTFIISKSDDERYVYGLSDFGSKHQALHCEEGFNKHGWLVCKGWRNFRFNKRSLRFIHTSEYGYVIAGTGIKDEINDEITDEITDTPYMEIGTCSLF